VTTRQGRPPKAYRSRAWKICLPEQLAGKYELLLMDPTHGTPERGARQEIFIALLQRVLDALQSGEQTIFVGDITHSLKSHAIGADNGSHS
jgi:hypothetical protein